MPTVQFTRTVYFPRKIAEELIELAQQSPDMEICGLVGGVNEKPIRVYPIDNVADNPGRHFLLDAKQQIDAMRQMRENKEELFAIYHSHPNGSPEPSREDIEKAAYPDALYLIIAPTSGGNPMMNGFYIREKQMRSADIALE